MTGCFHTTVCMCVCVMCVCLDLCTVFTSSSILCDNYNSSLYLIVASVSTLLYVPQLCSILIGYSFGGFQIFSLLEEVLIFTYPLSTKHLPPAITHFTFQEPENDPRPFVYVWVARNGLPTQGR